LTRDPYRRYHRRYRRYQRQIRRARRRNGGYPFMLPAPYEPVALIALSAVARFLYRHRSAFRPPLITAALFAGASILHRHHPGAWLLIAAVAATGVVFLGIPHQVGWPGTPGQLGRAGWVTRAWEACGITRLPERIYVTAIVAVSGAWLAAADAAGPARRPLPTIAVTATVILGIPWLAHRRRRAQVRIERTIQAWPGLAENMGLPGEKGAGRDRRDPRLRLPWIPPRAGG
jgi:S-DNA-T family DNA segregation ATPase FtsK/SpoIIIE